MTADSPVLIAVVFVYLAIVFGVSIWGYFHTETEVDFLAAGRSIGPWVGGAVLASTQISAGTYVGTLGRHYLTGVSWAWIWFGLWSGWIISAIFVAPKLRRFGALTVADYVGKRFASEGARTLAAALIIITYTILLTAQFQAIGEITSAIFGIEPLVAMTALLASTGFYTALGGVRSSSYIEFVQTLIMVLALVCAVPVIISHVGGVQALGEYVGSIEPRVTGWWFSWRELVAFGMAFGLSIAAAPYEMTRYYSMRDVTTVRYAIGISMAAQVADRRQRDDSRDRHARHLSLPALTGSGVEHHGVDDHVTASGLPVPGGDALGDHVHRQFDFARHRRSVCARPATNA